MNRPESPRFVCKDHIRAMARRLASEQAALRQRMTKIPGRYISKQEYQIRSRKIEHLRSAIIRELKTVRSAS